MGIAIQVDVRPPGSDEDPSPGRPDDRAYRHGRPRRKRRTAADAVDRVPNEQGERSPGPLRRRGCHRAVAVLQSRQILNKVNFFGMRDLYLAALEWLFAEYFLGWRRKRQIRRRRTRNVRPPPLRADWCVPAVGSRPSCWGCQPRLRRPSCRGRRLRLRLSGRFRRLVTVVPGKNFSGSWTEPPAAGYAHWRLGRCPSIFQNISTSKLSKN